MQFRKFPNTNIELSILGFGCMRLPLSKTDDPSSIDAENASAMLRYAIDRGVNYIDTAFPYHSKSRNQGGASEPFLGQALKGLRDKVYLATKLPTWLADNKAQMHQILDQQLKRLDTGHIDFYLAHNLNSGTWESAKSHGLLGFMDEAQKDGRIKYPGFSFHDQYSLFETIVQSYDWCFAQIQHNYLDVDYQAGQRGLMMAADRNLGIIIMEPLRGGFLIEHIPAQFKARLRELHPDWSLAKWGLKWLWNKNQIGVVLSGMSTMDQVIDNVAAADDNSILSRADFQALDEIRQYFQNNLKVNCTACAYCMPCPSSVNIPKCLSYYNDYYLVDSDEMKKRSAYYYGIQVAPEEKASNCVGCGQCESSCPQAIGISQSMKEIVSVFGS